MPIDEKITGIGAVSGLRDAWSMFSANKAAIAGLVIWALIVFGSIFGPLLYSGKPFEIVSTPMTPPGGNLFLGSDYMGRDVLAGIIYGAKVTLLVGFAATICTVVIGVIIGTLAGYYGKKVDLFLMRVTEFFQVLPPILLAMVLVTLFSPSYITVVIAIGSVNWISTARLTRAAFLQIKELDFVRAARATGAANSRIMWRIILPNALPPLIVITTLTIGSAILFEAALSFLGLTDPNVMTWGFMIGASRNYIWDSWWAVTFPGVAIFFTVLSISLIGDGLNDAMNLKLRVL